ncbi:hypothetical protein [Lunatimonas salinarum]|uniref:hypothetical protein n=1 Tax=Lunatimonas salinarum TaxID=1774590 RepID=UPI001ADF32FB|nr:hypothetical protein [Lunatimonas salinarum]
MGNIKEFVKEYSQLLANESPFVYEDEDGKRYKSVEEAYKSGKKVAIKNSNDSAIEYLKGLGIESKADVSKFFELLSHIFGMDIGKKSGTRTRRTYSNEEKAALMDAWHKADAANMSKVDFCKENDITYQTLMKWLREAKG